MQCGETGARVWAGFMLYPLTVQSSLLISFSLQGLAISPGLVGKALPALNLGITPPAAKHIAHCLVQVKPLVFGRPSGETDLAACTAHNMPHAWGPPLSHQEALSHIVIGVLVDTNILVGASLAYVGDPNHSKARQVCGSPLGQG